MHSGCVNLAGAHKAIMQAGLFILLFFVSILNAVAAETISINRDSTALDLTKAVSIFRDRGETFQVTTIEENE